MYCMGTNCQCRNCGKKWVITFKEYMKYKDLVNRASREQALGTLGAVASLASNNRLASINNTNIANAAYIRANQLQAMNNMDYVQDKYCPDCKSPCISKQQFYYLADDRTFDYIRTATKYEYDDEEARLNEEARRRKEEAQEEANWRFHIWTIIALIFCYPIGLILLACDKYVKPKTKKIIYIICGIFTFLYLISIIQSGTDKTNYETTNIGGITGFNNEDITLSNDIATTDKIIDDKEYNLDGINGGDTPEDEINNTLLEIIDRCEVNSGGIIHISSADYEFIYDNKDYCDDFIEVLERNKVCIKENCNCKDTEILEVTATEILKLAENENFSNVPFNASTEEIYNKYDGNIVTISGKIEDIKYGSIYLNCNDGGYNSVGADTTLVVYCKVANSDNYSIGQEVTITGTANCYRYAVVIEEN